ncbi:hypothetical protein [Plasticicumulans acidivorans]|uniref:Uncharacterized protein n=1 Tax=Plasticicumulans acidivorans TaxID=886464 RepID=A0A317N183_9GAMM|nr:hypothetical protein [Plasticicumulans acidivorans]PWV66023.1 hypothetical protein C7443_101511 [Plasticicumulans acidivorans]
MSLPSARRLQQAQSAARLRRNQRGHLQSVPTLPQMLAVARAVYWHAERAGVPRPDRYAISRYAADLRRRGWSGAEAVRQAALITKENGRTS